MLLYLFFRLAKFKPALNVSQMKKRKERKKTTIGNCEQYISGNVHRQVTQCMSWQHLSVSYPALQSLTQLTCSYETENQTNYLVCDLGNPMKSGTSVRSSHTHTSLALLGSQLNLVEQNSSCRQLKVFAQPVCECMHAHVCFLWKKYYY